MLTKPTMQRSLRGSRVAKPRPRAANTADHRAQLARRLTPRDRWLIRMLHEHHVLTTHQITDIAFPSARSARQRLLELYQWQVIDRFQPLIPIGAAPHHYVLAPAGAAVLAAEDGLDIRDLGYRRDRALGIAHSLRLAHLVGVNDWFTALIAHARRSTNTVLRAWWSETRCARHFGDLVRPDGYGRWRCGDMEIEFFLEFDLATESPTIVANKLAGYAALAAATAITTPLLIWLPTAQREAVTRRHLIRVWHNLDNPHTVPIATAAADLLDSHQPQPSPADLVWLPLTGPAAAGQVNDSPRRTLHHLHFAWPQLPAPTVSNPSVPDDTQSLALAPPAPMPPPTESSSIPR